MKFINMLIKKWQKISQFNRVNIIKNKPIKKSNLYSNIILTDKIKQIIISLIALNSGKQEQSERKIIKHFFKICVQGDKTSSHIQPGI